MPRLLTLALLAASACTMQADDRPLTVQFVTEEVFAPSCGKAQCHSTFGPNRTDIFDTVKGVQSSIVRNGLVNLSASAGDDREPTATASLIKWVTLPFGNSQDGSIGRMPYDAPLPREDIQLLERWIKEGQARGAQCDPYAAVGTACDHNTLKECGSDWNFAEAIEDCEAEGKKCVPGSFFGADVTTTAECM